MAMSKVAHAVDIERSASGLPIREIPGEKLSIPLLSPIIDRLYYFYFQGAEEYFQSRVQKYNSTVFRVNVPPGPFMAWRPSVVAVLDAASFRTLLNPAKVDKTDTFLGTYVPSFRLSGGVRQLPFLDSADPQHLALKAFLLRHIVSRMPKMLPAFHDSCASMFAAVEAAISASGAADFNKLLEKFVFDFTCLSLFDGKPPSAVLGDKAPKNAINWLIYFLHPVVSKSGLPWPIEDLLFHTFPFPTLLVKKDYGKLKDYYTSVAGPVLDRAQKELGISRDVTLHTLVFLSTFNAYGGYKIFLPILLKWIYSAGPKLHAKLAAEVRAAVAKAGGAITASALESMTLVKSVVWEALRINPPVEFQYGHARTDLVVESHDAAFRVKKGEMIFGWQPMATRDDRVFVDGHKFVPDRFTTAEGKKLLSYVVWSNGPEVVALTAADKQCPGRDMVLLVGRAFVAEFFLRYDTFEAELSETVLAPDVKIRSLTKAAN